MRNPVTVRITRDAIEVHLLAPYPPPGTVSILALDGTSTRMGDGTPAPVEVGTSDVLSVGNRGEVMQRKGVSGDVYVTRARAVVVDVKGARVCLSRPETDIQDIASVEEMRARGGLHAAVCDLMLAPPVDAAVDPLADVMAAMTVERGAPPAGSRIKKIRARF
jgi:hypothetical protein